jgi:hypothetical protein
MTKQQTLPKYRLLFMKQHGISKFTLYNNDKTAKFAEISIIIYETTRYSVYSAALLYLTAQGRA